MHLSGHRNATPSPHDRERRDRLLGNHAASGWKPLRARLQGPFKLAPPHTGSVSRTFPVYVVLGRPGHREGHRRLCRSPASPGPSFRQAPTSAPKQPSPRGPCMRRGRQTPGHQGTFDAAASKALYAGAFVVLRKYTSAPQAVFLRSHPPKCLLRSPSFASFH